MNTIKKAMIGVFAVAAIGILSPTTASARMGGGASMAGSAASMEAAFTAVAFTAAAGAVQGLLQLLSDWGSV
jgi:hypothetical protein